MCAMNRVHRLSGPAHEPRPAQADAGKQLLGTGLSAAQEPRLDAVLDDVQAALLAPLTPTERARLVRLLAKLS
jgi:hypothetical protein